MADIFISYAREDRSRIEPLARSLEGLGWSVFWDRTIPAGKTWRQVIGEALKTTRSIIVAWSEISVESEWVHEEADRGRKRNILIPVLLDNVDPPLGFGAIQAADLVNWDPAQSSPEFEKLIADIAVILGPPPRQIREAEQAAEEERKRKQREGRKRKEEENRKADEESQRLETEKRRIAEEEQKRAEAERKAEEERKRKEIIARQDAEEERKRKEAEAEADRARKEQVGRKAEPPKTEPPEPGKKRNNVLIGAMSALILAIVVGLALWSFRESRPPDKIPYGAPVAEAPEAPPKEVSKPEVRPREPQALPTENAASSVETRPAEPPLPKAPEAPAPAPQPRIVSSGQEILKGSYNFDLDIGRQGVSATDADIWWEHAAPARYLHAQNGAQFSYLGRVDFDDIPVKDLLTANYGAIRLNGSANMANQLADGTVILVRTKKGNFCKLRIEKYGIAAPGDQPEWPKGALLIKWKTFSP